MKMLSLNSLFPILLTTIILQINKNELTAQSKYSASTGTISFFSSAPIEDIRAATNSFSSEMDLDKGTLSFIVPIEGFIFKKKLMQKHFNEQYMESDKFPSAFFEGRFEQTPSGGSSQASQFETRVKGDITIKGVTRPLVEEVILRWSRDDIVATCKFNVRLEDFGIKIPRMLIRNIAEVVEVTIDVKYKKS